MFFGVQEIGTVATILELARNIYRFAQRAGTVNIALGVLDRLGQALLALTQSDRYKSLQVDGWDIC